MRELPYEDPDWSITVSDASAEEKLSLLRATDGAERREAVNDSHDARRTGNVSKTDVEWQQTQKDKPRDENAPRQTATKLRKKRCRTNGHNCVKERGVAKEQPEPDNGMETQCEKEKHVRANAGAAA